VASRRGGLWLCCAVLAVFVACSGKKRPFADELSLPEDVGTAGATGGEMPPGSLSGVGGAGASGSPGASSEGVPLPGAPCASGACDAGLGSGGAAGSVLSALGQPCAANADCESNVCAPDVDDFSRCCDRPCGEGDCERCSTAGVCGSPPVVASECPEVACPADDVCRDFQQAIAAGTCREAGSCSNPADCTFEWTVAAQEGQACECGDAGCSLAVSEPCTRNEDCASATCRATLAGASVCCAQACGAGQVCRADGSGCDVAPVCTNGQLRCDGASYQQCMAGQWVTQRECGALGCDLSLNGCRRSAGEACTSTAQCGEGACRDTATGTRVCCTAACDTACRRCTAAGTSCQLLNDDAACGAISCPADSTCRDFPASITQNRCIAGSCGAPADLCNFTARNAGQACSNTLFCDNSGNCNVSCVPSTEVCDGRDNDCDRVVDDGFDLQNDANNCGRCGNRCTTGVCQGGVCGQPPECEGNGVLGCPELGGTFELVCNGGTIENRSCPLGQGCGVNDVRCMPQNCPPRTFLPDCASRTARLFCADSGRDASVSDCPANRPICDANTRDINTPGSPIACQACLTNQDCIDHGLGTTCNPPDPATPGSVTPRTSCSP